MIYKLINSKKVLNLNSIIKLDLQNKQRIKICIVAKIIISMPSVTQLIENSQIYPLQSTLREHPELLYSLIDFITINPDPLIQNQQQCYVYPSKACEMLSIGSVFRVMVEKKTRKNRKQDETQMQYVYLDKLFSNILKNKNQDKINSNPSEKLQSEHTAQCLLGYINKFLISLARKTPEIYEYFKDNQQIMTALVKENIFLKAFQQFWTIFIIESTMSLYVFLKNLLLRALMFRIIDESDKDNLVVYETLTILYEQITKKLQLTYLAADQKQELEEICGSFHDEDFITLMILKVSSQKSQKSYYIGRFFNNLLKNPLNNIQEKKQELESKNEQQKAKQDDNNKEKQQTNIQQIDEKKEDALQIESANSKNDSKKYALSLHMITDNYIEALEDFFQAYENTENFMNCILPDQVQILKLLLGFSEKSLLPMQQQANLLKRLLVYSSIYKNNSVVHCMLLKMVTIITNQSHQSVFKQINVISFFMKNYEGQNTTMPENKYSLRSLIFKICKFWKDHDSQIGEFLTEEQSRFVDEIVSAKLSKIKDLTMYKAVEQLNIETSQIISKQEISQKVPQ